MIAFVLFSIRRAWQGFWRNALMSLSATLTMVLMLSLLAGFFVLQNVLLASLSFVSRNYIGLILAAAGYGKLQGISIARKKFLDI